MLDGVRVRIDALATRASHTNNNDNNDDDANDDDDDNDDADDVDANEDDSIWSNCRIVARAVAVDTLHVQSVSAW